MGGPKSSPPSSSDRRQWQRIFGTLVEILQSQQSQIETLADDRKFLERYIHIQHDRWTSKARLLESHIVQMKKEERKGRRVQAAKLDLMVGMPEREALCYKKQYELAESDLDDFRACVETLGAEISVLKEKLRSREVDDGGTGVSEAMTRDLQSTTALEGELRKLKHAYKRLSSKKEAEVSALLAEKDFVWNQLKNMESDYAGLLKIKRTELEQTNEAMEKLLHDLEKLQSSANEKDGIIARLEAERAKLELGVRRQTQEAEQSNAKLEQLQHDMEQLRILAKEKDETIAKLRSDLAKIEVDATKSTKRKSRFSKDLDTQRNSRNASATPAENCLRSSRKRNLESATGDASQKRRRTNEDSSGSRVANRKSRFSKDLDTQRNSRNASATPAERCLRSSRKRNSESATGDASQKRRRTNEDSSGSRVASAVNGTQQCSRGRQTRTISPVNSPRLFSANFKVPKLKSSPAIV